MSRRVQDAFAAVPRRRFLPRQQQRFAGHDAALDIGYGVTNSQPTTVRNMLELLDVEPGHRVLDVGSGSGWTTALLAQLVGAEGEVVGVERIPEILEQGRTNLGARFPWASVQQAIEGVLGWPAGAPYDRVLVSAEATRIPEELVDQLVLGGIMVVPVNSVMLRVSKQPDDLKIEEHGRYSFVPLVGGRGERGEP
jgi:protein-L-isoaspartate(D-aspartate) O-methyltransferase